MLSFYSMFFELDMCTGSEIEVLLCAIMSEYLRILKELRFEYFGPFTIHLITT